MERQKERSKYFIVPRKLLAYCILCPGFSFYKSVKWVSFQHLASFSAYLHLLIFRIQVTKDSVITRQNVCKLFLALNRMCLCFIIEAILIWMIVWLTRSSYGFCWWCDVTSCLTLISCGVFESWNWSSGRERLTFSPAGTSNISAETLVWTSLFSFDLIEKRSRRDRYIWRRIGLQCDHRLSDSGIWWTDFLKALTNMWLYVYLRVLFTEFILRVT